MKKEEADLQQKLLLFTHETKRLENAHKKLQKQFEALQHKLKASHKTLEQIITHMSDGFLFVTQKGTVSLYNPAAENIVEIPQQKVLGTSFWENFSDGLFGFPMGNALKNGHLPGRIFLSLSNSREIEVAPATIPGKGILLLLSDRTQLKQLEKSVQQGDRLRDLGEIAASLAHEIRNPLGGIEGFASLLKRELANPSQIQMVNSILEGSRLLNTLVTNVLEYARPLSLHFVPTDLNAFLRETARLAEANGHPCIVKIEKNHTITMDPKRMQLVLLSLIRNSYEAGSKTVEIILTFEGKILVKDKGEGISKKNLEKVFTPFFTTKTKGTGLGLSEAYKIMRAHGGSITIDSKIGKGTCITLDYED